MRKESGKTSYIERLNNTLRQRISRLVRKSLSFSKKIENHIGAIGYFIGDYNRHIRAAIEEDKKILWLSSILYLMALPIFGSLLEHLSLRVSIVLVAIAELKSQQLNHPRL